jgi:hypothetical protein
MFDRTISEALAIGALILSLVSLGGLGVVFRRQGRADRRYQQFLQTLPFATGEAVGPEVVLGVLSQTAQRLTALEARTEHLERAMPTCIQRVGLVRFNPFQDTGGDQSFVLVLLDAGGDGVIISSLHTRTATRLYAKPVRAGRATHALTGEEQQALGQALGGNER